MRKLLGGLVALLLLIPLTAQAVEVPCPDPSRPIHYLPYCLNEAEYLALTALPLITNTSPPITNSVAPVDLKGQARALITVYFPAWAVEAAMRVVGCETGYTFDPWSKNSSSGASGLFQHMPRYWADRSWAAGWGGWSVFDPEANVAVAAWLWGQTGTWRHWSCKP